MKTTIQLEWTDLLAAMRLNQRPRVWGWVGLVIIYGMLAFNLVIGLLQLAAGQPSYLSFTWPLFLLGAIPLLYYFVLLPFNARQTFQQMKDLHGPVQIEVTPQGLRHINALSQTLRPWHYFVKWQEDRHTLILYIANNALVFLPKRAFADEAVFAAIRSHLKAQPPQPQLLSDRLRGYFIYGLIVVVVVVFLLQFVNSQR